LVAQAKKLVTFLSDKDGLTLIEFIALMILIIWIITTIWMLILLNTNQLTDVAISFYAQVNYSFMSIILGLVGKNVFSNISVNNPNNNNSNNYSGYNNYPYYNNNINNTNGQQNNLIEDNTLVQDSTIVNINNQPTI